MEEIKCDKCHEEIESYEIIDDETLCDDCSYDLKVEKKQEADAYTYTQFDAEYDQWKHMRDNYGND